MSNFFKLPTNDIIVSLIKIIIIIIIITIIIMGVWQVIYPAN